MTTDKVFGKMNKKLLIGILIGVISGILLSLVIFLNVTSYRFGHVVNYVSNLVPFSSSAEKLSIISTGNIFNTDVAFPSELTTWLSDNLASTDIGCSASAEAFSRSNSADSETLLYNSDYIIEGCAVFMQKPL